MAVTRQEVEEELNRKSASIAGSISRIKKELSFPTQPIRTVIRNHPVETILGVVAAGLLLGWSIGGKRKRKKAPERSDAKAGSLGASQFLNFVEAGRESGLTTEEAISRALAASQMGSGQPVRFARPSLSNRLTDHAVDMAEAMIKTAMRVAVREGAAWLADSVRSEKPRASQ